MRECVKLAAVFAALLLVSCAPEKEPPGEFPYQRLKTHIEKSLLSCDWSADAKGANRSIRTAGYELEDYVKLAAKYTIIYFEGNEESTRGRYYRSLLEQVDESDFEFEDINGDGTLEVLLHVSHGNNMEKELTIIWRYGNMIHLRYHSHALLKDIDGNGRKELVVLDVFNYGGAAGDLTVCWEDIYLFDKKSFVLSNDLFRDYYKEKRDYLTRKRKNLDMLGRSQSDRSSAERYKFAVEAIDRVIERIGRLLGE